MRSKHRKTLVREEEWPLIDGWYWCPIPLIEKRISDMADEYDGYMGKIGAGYDFREWKARQYKIAARLAHKCEDDSIRAPSWVQTYTRKSGCRSIYGRCKHCREPLSNGVKTIIIMEDM